MFSCSLIALLLLLRLEHSLSSSLGCPDRWTIVDAKCYRIIDIKDYNLRGFGALGSYELASNICHQLDNATLAMPKSSVSQLALSQLFYNQNSSVASSTAWIGIKPMQRNDEIMYWNDGSTVNLTAWANHEPLFDKYPKDDDNSDDQTMFCVFVETMFNNRGKWYISNCGFSGGAVCELNMRMVSKDESTNNIRFWSPLCAIAFIVVVLAMINLTCLWYYSKNNPITRHETLMNTGNGRE